MLSVLKFLSLTLGEFGQSPAQGARLVVRRHSGLMVLRAIQSVGLASLIAALAQIGLGASSADAQIASRSQAAGGTAEHTASFFGTLNSASVGKLKAKIRAGARVLTIESGGGDAGAAMELAETIQKYKVKVIVEGLCYSACASYIIPASPNVELRGQVMLGFHHTESAMFLIAKSRGKNVPNSLSSELAEGARKEEELYRRSGVDSLLLLVPIYELAPSCALVIKLNGKYEMVLSILGAPYWVPSQGVLGQFGYRIAGSKPISPRQFYDDYGPQILARRDPLWLSWSPADMSIIDEVTFKRPSRDAVERRLSSLPTCPISVTRTEGFRNMVKATVSVERSN